MEKGFHDFLAVMVLKGTLPEHSKDDAIMNPEIIQTSVVLVGVKSAQIEEDQFHSYVRPLKNPILTDRCVRLTGVKQFLTDQAQPWPAVLQKLEEWLASKGLVRETRFLLVTLGQASAFADLVESQWKISNADPPRWMHKVVNLQMEFHRFMDSDALPNRLTVEAMCEECGIKPETNRTNRRGAYASSARDEAFNLAMVTSYLLKKGCQFQALDNLFT